MHAALAIAQQVVALLKTVTYWNPENVVRERVVGFSRRDNDLPAVSVFMAEDQPVSDNGQENMAFIDSELTIQCVVFVSQPTEEEVIDQLLEMRRQIHIALMADYTLGLSFVSDTRYGGASPPDIEDDGGSLIGRMEVTWKIQYRMRLSDPQWP